MNEFLTLKDHVYHFISKKIMAGELLPDEKINESDIVAELNISRTPVREALIQLASEGLLENVPRKGFVLRPISERKAVELYQVIALLDGCAAKNACPKLTDKHLKDMDFYISSMDLAINLSNHEMYYELQGKFHQTYLDLCDNATLVDTITQMKKKFVRKVYKPEEIEHMNKEVLDTNADHRKILQLFKDKKCDELEAAVRHHWNEALAYLETL